MDLIRSYLPGRFQSTCLNEYRSQLEEIKYGVPEGFILGPWFSIIYISDIINIPQTPDVTLCALVCCCFFL